jgi:uncharacterized RDD family membrane protein YckC
MLWKTCPACKQNMPLAKKRCGCGYNFAQQYEESIYQTKGKGFRIRALAQGLDILFFGFILADIPILLITPILQAIVVFLGNTNVEVGEELWFIFTLLWAFIDILLYSTIFEGLCGASIGKWCLRMRVIKLDGQPCGFKAAFIRNILLFIDLMFFGLIGYLNMYSSRPRKQRFGDKVAGTVVVGRNSPLILQERWTRKRVLLAVGLYLITTIHAAGLLFLLIIGFHA